MYQFTERTINNPAAGADWTFTPSNTDKVLLRSITGRLVTSATAGYRSATIVTSDETGNAIARDIAAVNQPAGVTTLYSWRPGNSQYGTDANQPSTAGGAAGAGTLTSVSASGQVTSPALGAAIATLTTPGAGTYSITVQAAFLGGSPTAATDSLNFELKVGASVIGVMAPVPVAAGSIGPPQTFLSVAVPGATSVTVNAIAAGTVGAIYSASITATAANAPATGTTAAGSLPGFWLPNGAKITSATNGLQAGDQWSQLIATFEVADLLDLERLLASEGVQSAAPGVTVGY